MTGAKRLMATAKFDAPSPKAKRRPSKAIIEVDRSNTARLANINHVLRTPLPPPVQLKLCDAAALQRSELLLAEAQQIAHIGSWNWNLDSNAIEWSDEHYRIFGFEPQDRPITLDLGLSHVHPEDREHLKQILARSIQSRQPFECTFRLFHDDGSMRTALSRGRVTIDETGRPVRMSGTIQDVTQRMKAEEDLRRSESLMAEAQHVAHLGSWSRNLQSGELVWSDELYRIFGLRPQEIRMTFESFLNLLQPDDRDGLQKVLHQALRDRQPFEYSMRVLRRDGTVRDVYVRGIVASDESANPVRTFGTVQDVTEHKGAEEALRASEERVRLLLESTAEAIYGVDVEGNCIFSNPACLRLLDYSDASDFLGRPMHALIHHAQDDGTRCPKEACGILRAFLRNEPVHTDDQMLWRSDGTAFPAEYWCYPVGQEGQVVGAVVTFLDITQRKRLEQGILEISERERRRIGQDLHDDLCQQLAGIAFTGRLLQQRLAARSLPEAGVAWKIVQGAQQATARARDLAKGLHPVRLETDGLAAALGELSTMLESVFNVSCRFRCRADRQSKRLADPAIAIQLYRIAQESATNAVKHGRAKEICISFSVDKGRMKLTIADDGVGIADVFHGGGMGLPVMYQRARVIGAALSISKRRGGGTLVTCALSGRPSVPANGRNTQKRAPRGRLEKSLRNHKAHGYVETSIETFSQVAHDIIC